MDRRVDRTAPRATAAQYDDYVLTLLSLDTKDDD
jgi:hypothetical protein